MRIQNMTSRLILLCHFLCLAAGLLLAGRTAAGEDNAGPAQRYLDAQLQAVTAWNANSMYGRCGGRGSHTTLGRRQPVAGGRARHGRRVGRPGGWIVRRQGIAGREVAGDVGTERRCSLERYGVTRADPAAAGRGFYKAMPWFVAFAADEKCNFQGSVCPNTCERSS